MKISLDLLVNGRRKPVNSKIRICIECGSTLVLQNQKIILCRDCGDVRGVREMTFIKTIPKKEAIEN